MPFIPFFSTNQDTAIRETRRVQVLKNENPYGIPAGDYEFIEYFCSECDCRRVFLNVYYNEVHSATIAYGWAPIKFYKKAFPHLSKKDLQEFIGPAIDSFQHQTSKSNGILNLFRSTLLTDVLYMKRIESHYKLFKDTLKRTGFPSQSRF